MAEEFVLIPKEHFAKDNPVMEKLLLTARSPADVESKAAHLGYLQRLPPPSGENGAGEVIQESPTTPHADKTTPTVNVDDNSLLRSKIFRELPSFKRNQIERSNIILEKIQRNPRTSLMKEDFVIYLDGRSTGIHVASLLYNLQQSRKKLSKSELQIVQAIHLPQHVVANQFARTALEGAQSSASDDYDDEDDNDDDRDSENGSQTERYFSDFKEDINQEESRSEGEKSVYGNRRKRGQTGKGKSSPASKIWITFRR